MVYEFEFEQSPTQKQLNFIDKLQFCYGAEIFKGTSKEDAIIYIKENIYRAKRKTKRGYKKYYESYCSLQDQYDYLNGADYY